MKPEALERIRAKVEERFLAGYELGTSQALNAVKNLLPPPKEGDAGKED